jgi:hypothetical protein
MKERIQNLENLKLDWCEKIKIALDFHSKDLIKKTLNKTFLDIIVRWFPQIDQEGYDSYSAYYSCRNRNATLMARAKLLTRLNLKFSKHALLQIKQSNKPTIHYEHNPPVDFIVSSLIENKKILRNKEEILAHLKKLDYSVVILTKDEAKKLEKNFKKTGRSDERLNCALGINYQSFLSPKLADIKNLILIDNIKFKNLTTKDKEELSEKLRMRIEENNEIFPDLLFENLRNNRKNQIDKLIKKTLKEFEKEKNNIISNNDL